MVVKNTEAARGVGGSDGGTVAERENSADVLSTDSFQDRVGRRFRRFEMYWNRPVAPGIIELVTAIGYKPEIDAELLRGFVKAADLVPEFGSEDEESRHLILFRNARRARR